MRCGILCQLLWLWPFLSYNHATPIWTVQEDTRALISTIVNRIDELSFMQTVPSSQISNFDFIPTLQSVSSLLKMDEALVIYQKVLSSLVTIDMTQIINDLGDLRNLIHAMAESRGCPVLKASGRGTIMNLSDILKVSNHTLAVVTLRRVQKSLQDIQQQLDLSLRC
ncbi:PREDICTED: leptin [Elephantulus edwardii]|uniref:leptin n=1 Tax=Elephantulus edwardii TaxID=28737 RepID=UPI0003F06E66|nr:PREDICTED: leptin [Elephantulus edwardii]